MAPRRHLGRGSSAPTRQSSARTHQQRLGRILASQRWIAHGRCCCCACSDQQSPLGVGPERDVTKRPWPGRGVVGNDEAGIHSFLDDSRGLGLVALSDTETLADAGVVGCLVADVTEAGVLVYSEDTFRLIHARKWFRGEYCNPRLFIEHLSPCRRELMEFDLESDLIPSASPLLRYADLTHGRSEELIPGPRGHVNESERVEEWHARICYHKPVVEDLDHRTCAGHG